MVGISFPHVKYIIFGTIAKTVLFLLWYWKFIELMPQSDLMKPVWIFIDSIVTGWIGSLIARLLSGFYRFKLTFRFFFSNALVSAIYALFVWLGIIGLMLGGGEFDWIRFSIIALVVNLLITWAAYSGSNKVAEALKKAIG